MGGVVFAVWLGGFVVLALVLHRQPVALIAVALGLRVAIPSVAAVVMSGATTDGQLQPASYFLGIAFLITLATRPQMYVAEFGRRFWFWFVLFFAFAAAAIVSVFQGPPVSNLVLLDTLGFGIILCLMTRATIGESPAVGRRIALAVIWIAAAESVLGIMQWITGSTLVWVQYMSRYYWWSPTATRVSGSVGAWLDLALLLAVAIPLTAVIRNLLLRLGTIALLLIALILSQSRAALVVAVICIIVQLFMSHMNVGARLFSIVAVAVGAWLITTSDIVTGLVSRFSGQEISAEARTLALDFALNNIWSRPWYGSGFGSNGLTRDLGLISSFENGYLMYAWDIGVPFTLLLIGALFSPLLFGLVRGTVVTGTWLSLAAAVVLVGLYSGIQTPGPGSWIFLITVGLCVPKPNGQPEQEPRLTEATVEAQRAAEPA